MKFSSFIKTAILLALIPILFSACQDDFESAITEAAIDSNDSDNASWLFTNTSLDNLIGQRAVIASLASSATDFIMVYQKAGDLYCSTLHFTPTEPITPLTVISTVKYYSNGVKPTVTVTEDNQIVFIHQKKGKSDMVAGLIDLSSLNVANEVDAIDWNTFTKGTNAQVGTYKKNSTNYLVLIRNGGSQDYGNMGFFNIGRIKNNKIQWWTTKSNKWTTTAYHTFNMGSNTPWPVTRPNIAVSKEGALFVGYIGSGYNVSRPYLYGHGKINITADNVNRPEWLDNQGNSLGSKFIVKGNFGKTENNQHTVRTGLTLYSDGAGQYRAVVLFKGGVGGGTFNASAQVFTKNISGPTLGGNNFTMAPLPESKILVVGQKTKGKDSNLQYNVLGL